MAAKSMRGFAGFPAKSSGNTTIPNQFFSELLPLIDDLAELKITIYCFWAVQQREGEYRYVRRQDMLGDDVLMSGLAASAPQAEKLLQHGLECAVARGSLIHITLPEDELYFINTERGRRAVEALEKGDWLPGKADQPISLIVERPNIFTLYEQNIGPLTPMLSDLLRDAEATYPADWVAEAMRIAVENNIRNWKYIEAILNRWSTQGKPRVVQATEDGHPYLQDEYFRRRKEQE